MSDEPRRFFWMNSDLVHDERLHALGVHAEVMLFELASFAARSDPQGTLSIEQLADVFRLHTSGPDSDEVDPNADLALLVDGGFVERTDDGGVRMTSPELFAYGDDPGADVHLMNAARYRRQIGDGSDSFES